MRKIPAITLVFWIMKICATTLGETAGDLLSMTMQLGYGASSLILIGLFLATLGAQIAAVRYHPPLFWAVILSTSTAGTTMSDFMDRTMGLGYAKGALLLVFFLCIVLGAWWATEKSLDVNQINTRRAEVFYWAAILFSNTLGTALGDFLADDSGLGFAGGALLIGGLLALVALALFFTKASRIFLFWAAFVLTRPFGATAGDVLTKPREAGGVGLGTIGSSAVLAAVLILFVIHSVRKLPRPVPNPGTT